MRRHGAEVYDIYDCLLKQMEAKFAQFVQSLQKGDIAFLFYAGHGCMWKNHQLLIAKGTDPDTLAEREQDPEEIDEKSMKVGKILEKMFRENAIEISASTNLVKANRNRHRWTR